MEILFQNRQRKVKIPTKRLKKAARIILDVSACQDKELSLSFTGDRFIQRLNREYRKINAPTDVLAFAMQEGEFTNLNPNILGDVVISTETALRQAEQASHELETELYILLIHGILHLLGYDHERSLKEERRMKKREAELLEILRREMEG